MILPVSQQTEQALRVLQQAYAVSQTNLINAQTTRTSENKPYKAQQVSFEARLDRNSDDPTKVTLESSIDEDLRPGEKTYQPHHPHADARGFVEHSNVSIHQEAATQIFLKNHIDSIVRGHSIGEKIFDIIIK